MMMVMMVLKARQTAWGTSEGMPTMSNGVVVVVVVAVVVVVVVDVVLVVVTVFLSSLISRIACILWAVDS